MDEIEFTFNGERRVLSRAQVLKAMQGQIPGQIHTYAANVGGTLFPVKQVLASSLRVPRTSFISTRAQDILTKLEFEVVNVQEQDLTPAPGGAYRDLNIRVAALSQAVALMRGRDSSTREVLGAADDFAVWLVAAE